MHLRYVAIFLLLGFAIPALGQETRTIERLLYESMREAHDKGADLFNRGEVNDCYRMFQGSLITARGLLGHRTELQKKITDGMAKADTETSIKQRAFLLHELIEKVRDDLLVATKNTKGSEAIGIAPREVKANDAKKGEALTVPPREVKPEPKPVAKVAEIKSGVVGRVLWQGQPLAEVEVAFVTLSEVAARVYETTSGAQGVYTIANLKPGKYAITIVPGPKCTVKKLPERYATTTTTPLVFEVKGEGEKLDFMLQ